MQTWRIERITHNDVLVRPAHARQALAPFWRADERDRGFELSEKIGLFLANIDERLKDPELAKRLEAEYRLRPEAARALLRYVEAQRSATGTLPHRHRLVVEHVADPQGTDGRRQTILHTFWGGRVNRPFGMALQAAWRKRHGVPLELIHDDDCVVLTAPEPIRAEEVLDLVSAGEVEGLLREQLESTGFFGARFRAAAGCALLLPREGFRRRTPLWVSRQRAKELLEGVRRFEDFPILLETWRTCLADDLDLDNLRVVLDELRDGRIEVREATTAAPSPFAAGVSWKRTNELMYEDDTPSGGPSRLRQDLLHELVFAARLRPRIAPALADEFRRKLQRTYPGYAPRSASELLAWVVERVAIPVGEWGELLGAVGRDHGLDPGAILAELAGKVVALAWRAGEAPSVVCAVESVPRLVRALERGQDGFGFSSATLDGGPAGEAVAALASLRAHAGRGRG